MRDISRSIRWINLSDCRISVDRLQDAHSPIVEVRGIVVVGNPAPDLTAGHAQMGWLYRSDRLVDSLGCLATDEIHVVEVAGVTTLAIREGVAVGSAVRMA